MISLRGLLPYLWYPLGMGAAACLFHWLLGGAIPLALAVYLPVGLVGLFVLWLQQRFPQRADWRPDAAEVKVDITFMALVQIALPSALAVALALALPKLRGADAAASFWPHAAPLPVQIALMVLVVDGLRYGLHRACHHFPQLWRLHAVHHAPALMYSLNSARFHPLEKTLHFGLDTAPFMALGVADEVMAGYFVLYAANGLFQHSNVRLRYSWLNYVVGSAQTHRWHHARDPNLAPCNFGSTTAVWDLLFGTWHCNKHCIVKEVGIMDQTIPKGFIAQIKAPFAQRFSTPGRSIFARWLANVLVKMRLELTLVIARLRIAIATRDPMRVQRALLARIVHRNRDTAFGLVHRFGATANYEAFARTVPIHEYEALRPYVDAEIERGESALTRQAPRQYARTSGSTGIPKDIPLVPEHLHALRRIHETAVAFQYRVCPDAFSGGILAIVSPACEGALANGKPYGSASGIVAGNTPELIKEKFVAPAEIFGIADSRVKYLLILRLALATRDISYIGTANSTTLLALMTLYREHRAALNADVRSGTFFLAAEVPTRIWAAVRTRLCACPERAHELDALHATGAEPRLGDLWPCLRLIVTWTCASAGTAVSALRRELSPSTRVLELGYIASEFRATITIGRRADAGLPTLETHFFEFVERDRWDRGERDAVTLDDVRKGVDYYIIVTTPSGLYRYFINDVVRVTGFLHRTPLLKFVQKGKGVTNLTGEKLYESQVLGAVRAAMGQLGRAVRFVLMLADEETSKYHLYVESDAGPRPLPARLAQAVDAKLAQLNIEYRAKRESARLCIEAHWLRHATGDIFKRFCVANGQREGQYKPVALTYRKGFAFDIDRFVEA